MKKLAWVLAGVLALGSAMALADTATEQGVAKTIMDGNAYVKKNLKGQADSYSKDGAMEFWSSGGLMNEVKNTGRPEEYVSFNINVKHIRVSTVVPGKVAVAHYYSEGSMHPKGAAAIGNYRTRVSQVYVNEDGRWKIRSSHWSPVQGGAGTSITALTE